MQQQAQEHVFDDEAAPQELTQEKRNLPLLGKAEAPQNQKAGQSDAKAGETTIDPT